jgi:hypothetical protein
MCCFWRVITVTYIFGKFTIKSLSAYNNSRTAERTSTKVEMNGQLTKLASHAGGSRALRHIFQCGGGGLKHVPCILTEDPYKAAAVFGDEPNYNHPPATTFSRCHSMQLLAAFPRLKIGLRGHCFLFVKEIQQNMTAGLTAMLKENCKGCFKQWHNTGTHAYM